MDMPSAEAMSIVNQFGWSSNVARNGRLIGQQYVVAEAIDEVLAEKQGRIDLLRTGIFGACNDLGRELGKRRPSKRSSSSPSTRTTTAILQ